MGSLRMREVFVPGGLPAYTYVRRESLALEDRLKRATDNLCKLVTVTGPTKSGKSVLTQTVFPRSSVAWFDGGALTDEDDLWSSIVARLGHFTQVTRSSELTLNASLRAEAKAQLKLPFLAKGEGGIAPEIGTQGTVATSSSRTTTTKTVAIEKLRESKCPLVIDDFHYLTRDQQGSVIRALKALISDGHPVIVLAIPHRRYDAIRVEKEMTGRIEHIEIPTWKPDELTKISTLGFECLNLDVAKEIERDFVNEALGSPHLMQEFCRQLCEQSGIEKTSDTTLRLDSTINLQPLYRKVAEGTSKVIFERLATGPRQRRDRKQRHFIDGSTGDIYVAVLRAIAISKPGMSVLKYDDLRAALRQLLKEDAPSTQQVSRVLEKMTEISTSDSSSSPVLDWEKQEGRLHITDPFFAFFLKWGLP